MPGIKPTSKRLLDANSRQQWVARLDDYVNSLAWSPDGKMLAAASVSGPIAIFNGKTGQVHHALDGHTFGTNEVAWNSAGTLLASAGQDGSVRIWDPHGSGQELRTLAGGASWVEHLAWSPQGNLLATAAGRKLRLWDAEEGKLLQEYPDHQSTISDVQWQPGTTTLTSAAYGCISFWQPESHEILRSLEWKGSILVLTWSPDGNYIATGDQDATVHFWIVRQSKDLQMYGYPTKVRELSWDGGSRYLATGGGPVVTIWDCSGKGPEGSKPIELQGHAATLSAIAFAHHGPCIASADQDGKLIFWQVDRPKRPLVQASFEGGISQLTWSPDDQLIAVGTEAGIVTVCTPPQKGNEILEKEQQSVQKIQNVPVLRNDGKMINVVPKRGQLFTCQHGCCCARTERGFAPGFSDLYHAEWERRKLRNHVHLTHTACLGPCSLANVALLLFDGHSLWFHSLNTETLVIALYEYIEALLAAETFVSPPAVLQKYSFDGFVSAIPNEARAPQKVSSQREEPPN